MQWTVERDGARSDCEKRIIFRGDEPSARQRYAAAVEKMRQGSVSLIDPSGVVTDHKWAPRLRSRW